LTKSFQVPIALLNFNRPELTRQVFEVVRQIRPRRLLIIADGPRMDMPDDARLCAEVRAVFDEIDWDCEVTRNFSDTNMGSFRRNSTGLNWFFAIPRICWSATGMILELGLFQVTISDFPSPLAIMTVISSQHMRFLGGGLPGGGYGRMLT
jgi:hypothetical protein